MATTKCPVGTVVKLTRFPNSDHPRKLIGRVVAIIDDDDAAFCGYAIWESEREDNSLHTADYYLGRDTLYKYFYIDDEMFKRVKWDANCELLSVGSLTINIEELI